MNGTLVFLLEEPSARDLLEGVLPKLVPETIRIQYLVFEGKQDLEQNIARKIRVWLAPNSRFMILRDQDAGDCRNVKRLLLEKVPIERRAHVLVRVACRELESWVLGDWNAIASAFEKPTLAANATKVPFRDPDKIAEPVDALKRVLPDYRKRDGARRIGKILDPDQNASPSFQVFCRGVLRLVESINASTS